ncbi:MAG: thioredoxin, partial [Planctomycetaceae bacterium]|nr:thioredoxin [Planctomycetaceae bacterium]
MQFTRLILQAAAAASFVLAATPVFAQVTAAQLFRDYRPVHADVDFDTPTGAEVEQCRVEIERGEGYAGYVVFGPTGQPLRRFTDTNGDGKADLYRFYHLGLEVYRDIDSNKNETPDQHRWLNWGGTRWGVDQNEDGRIDGWRVLSAQECAR